MNTRNERINPYLFVAYISKSVEYYVEVLGFDRNIETPNLGIIERDGHQIHFIRKQDYTAPTHVWIGVEDVAVLYQMLKENDANIHQEPTNYSWAYQMMIKDLDGNLLIYGSAPIKDLPIQNSL